MQNKCNCGREQCSCQNAGFVPVSGNWDFSANDDCGCQQSYTRRANRRSGCQQCGEYTNSYTRESDCQCERCDDSRTVGCCDQNTYIRSNEDCDCNAGYSRNRSSDCDTCNGNSNYNRTRSSCDGDCDCENCTRNRSRSRSNDCDECNDDSAYTRNRSGSHDKDCGCSENAAYTRNRSGCGCDKDNGSTYARSGKNRGVGMIKGVTQEIDEIFESESALRAGTIFPELHKPLNGYCPCDSNCGTCAQAAAFAAWELRLYLNTHPNDEEALKLFRKLCKEAEDTNYATTFLEDDGCTSGWNWVRNPWPWEYDCQCGD